MRITSGIGISVPPAVTAWPVLSCNCCSVAETITIVVRLMHYKLKPGLHMGQACRHSTRGLEIPLGAVDQGELLLKGFDLGAEVVGLLSQDAESPLGLGPLGFKAVCESIQQVAGVPMVVAGRHGDYPLPKCCRLCIYGAYSTGQGWYW